MEHLNDQIWIFRDENENLQISNVPLPRGWRNSLLCWMLS
jgi:hypothetical protein